jgi:hypothetical protein
MSDGPDHTALAGVGRQMSDDGEMRDENKTSFELPTPPWQAAGPVMSSAAIAPALENDQDHANRRLWSVCLLPVGPNSAVIATVK